MGSKQLSRHGHQTPEARGLRVRYVRDTLLRYSRRKFGDKYDIPAPTLQNWEIGKYGGLTEKGALKLLNAFASEGIPVTLEWLFYGHGLEPSGPIAPTSLVQLDQNITRELQFFHQLHPNTIDFIVTDNCMSPMLRKGDLVAGIRYFSEEIKKISDEYCIIQLKNGETMISSFEVDKNTCLLKKMQVKSVVLTLPLDAIFSIAPILWIRRKVIK
ncbi:MAG: hypothetical protein QM752_06355 [Gammaproteobacteria bacterium]